MKILVKDPKTPTIRLWLPTGLVLNRFTAYFIPDALEQQGISVTREQAFTFIKVLGECKRRFPDWVLTEVEGASGEKVYIKL